MHPHVREEGCRGVEKTLSVRHGGHAEGTGERSVCVCVCMRECVSVCKEGVGQGVVCVCSCVFKDCVCAKGGGECGVGSLYECFTSELLLFAAVCVV
jgi:hypothetical protein